MSPKSRIPSTKPIGITYSVPHTWPEGRTLSKIHHIARACSSKSKAQSTQNRHNRHSDLPNKAMQLNAVADHTIAGCHL